MIKTIVIASGATKSLCGEANSSRSPACDEFASSFLLAMTKRFCLSKTTFNHF